MGKVLGILQQPPQLYLKRGLGAETFSDAEIDNLLAQRRAARSARNFGESDRIRDLLSAGGVLLEDRPGGDTGWRRA
jgi:cysteinyl-tRNA synthetase